MHVNLDQFVKILSFDLCHNRFQYQEGFNVDTSPFRTSSRSTERASFFDFPHGLHFTTMRYLPLFISFGVKMADVKLPVDSQVLAHPTGTVWKADKVILTNITDMQNHPCWYDTAYCNHALELSGLTIQYVREPSYKQTIQAVKQNGLALQFIRNQTQELCYLAIAQNTYALQYVSHLSNAIEKLSLFAVQKNSRTFRFVHQQTPEICFFAVRDNGLNLRFIQRQSDKLCLTAVTQNYAALQYVKNQTEDICLAAIWQNPHALQYVKCQTENMCLESVKKDGMCILWVRKQTEDICIAAVEADPLAIQFVDPLLGQREMKEMVSCCLQLVINPRSIADEQCTKEKLIELMFPFLSKKTLSDIQDDIKCAVFERQIDNQNQERAVQLLYRNM